MHTKILAFIFLMGISPAANKNARPHQLLFAKNLPVCLIILNQVVKNMPGTDYLRSNLILKGYSVVTFKEAANLLFQKAEKAHYISVEEFESSPVLQSLKVNIKFVAGSPEKIDSFSYIVCLSPQGKTKCRSGSLHDSLLQKYNIDTLMARLVDSLTIDRLKD